MTRRERLNAQFAQAPGVAPQLQALDFYAPREGSGFSVIVWIHGGAMTGGDKALGGILALKPDYFLARGYAFASVNYRLAPIMRGRTSGLRRRGEVRGGRGDGLRGTRHDSPAH